MPHKDKEKRKVYARAYYAAHPYERSPESKERHLFTNKIRYAAHRKELTDKQKAYNAAHLEEGRARGRAYHAAHREELNAKKAEWCKTHQEELKRYRRSQRYRDIQKASRIKHRDEILAKSRKRRYGISQEAFDTLLEGQGKICAVCKKPDWNGKGPHIDHDHVTGKVRGILCSNCNAAVGMIRDDPKIAQAMIDYLIRFKTEE